MLDKLLDTISDAAIQRTGVRWNIPHTHFSPSFLIGSMILTEGLKQAGIRGTVSHKGELSNVHSLKKLEEKNWPLYLLPKELCESLDKTNISQEYPLEHLKWPFEAIAFGFPRNHFKSTVDDKSDIASMIVYRVKRSEYKYNIRGIPKYDAYDRFSIIYVDEKGMISTGTWPLASTYKQVSEDYFDIYSSDKLVKTDPKKDSQEILRMGAFALKMLMFLNIKAVGEPAGTLDKTIRHKRLDQRIQVRTPHMIRYERTYTSYDSKSTGESGIKLEGGWRMGHLKGVWTGAGRKDLETRWIEPYPYGKEREKLFGHNDDNAIK